MSERGKSSRGRGAGRGRGRGRGGTMTWEYEVYKPDENVYNSLYHIRRAPPTVVHTLSSDCPIPNAQSRILRRGQTDDGYRRHYYVVEVRHNVSSSNARKGEEDEVEVLEVLVDQIDQYVSPRELERYENGESRAETQAEAAVRRAEAEEQKRRRLEKNARASGKGRGRGGRILQGIGVDPGDESQSSTRGHRGRGRPRGRASRRGRGGFATPVQIAAEEEIEAVDPVTPVDDEMSENEADIIQRTIAESEEESLENDPAKLASPDLARSSFVANSALPVSPVAPHHNSRPVEAMREMLDEDALSDNRPRSMSSAAEQLHFERRERRQLTHEDEHVIPDRDYHRGHLAKKQRTGSATSSRPAPPSAYKKTAVPARSNSRIEISRHAPASKEDPRRRRPAMPTKSKVQVVESSESSSESDSESESSESSQDVITVHVPARKPKHRPTRGGRTPSGPARDSQYGGSRVPSTHRYNSSQPARSSKSRHSRAISIFHQSKPERSRDLYKYMENDMDDEDDDYDDDAERGVTLDHHEDEDEDEEEESANDNVDEDDDTDDDEDEGAEEYVVEEILDHNFESGLKYYLVKWQGYENSDWLEEKDLGGAKEVLVDYKRRIAIRKGKQPMR
ncbi:unnamed protein product [Periconia digitata]|uniref:Chromo domain-containing protein n=1 Tax=Periconia digitata TaxID=1303443 RepID=A0A9W4UUQ8_9PLEO|nr:unnamed protein product [Periconia digitata]